MKFNSDQYLFNYEPLDYFKENLKKSQKHSYKAFIETIDDQLAYKLYDKYKESKEKIELIKANYDRNVAPIKDSINLILSDIKDLSLFFKKNSQYTVTKEGFLKKQKFLNLIWNSQSSKSKFLYDFKNLLRSIKEINHNKYKQKFFRNYKFGVNFHGDIEHISLFEFKDDLKNFVSECMSIFSDLFYNDYEYFYINGAGSNGPIRVFWNDLDSIGTFFNFEIPSEKYTNDLEDKQKYFEENILTHLEYRLGKFEREKQAGSTFSFIYVLSNASYKNTYKIGSTSGTPRDRALELNTTGVLYPFKVAFQIEIKNAQYYELKAHKLLDKFRVKNNREFFEIDLDKIKSCLNDLSKITDKGEKKLSLAELKKEIGYK